jgi:hypothetical protein
MALRGRAAPATSARRDQLGRAPGRVRDETEGWPMSGGARVLLAVLSQRTSARGRPYLSGRLEGAGGRLRRRARCPGRSDLGGLRRRRARAAGRPTAPPLKPPERDSGSGREIDPRRTDASPEPSGRSSRCARVSMETTCGWARGRSRQPTAVLNEQALPGVPPWSAAGTVPRWAPGTFSPPLGCPHREGTPPDRLLHCHRPDQVAPRFEFWAANVTSWATGSPARRRGRPHARDISDQARR